MSSPSSPRAISPHASCTLRISSKVHSAPSNSGRTFVALRLGSFAWVVVTALSSPSHGGLAVHASRRGVAGSGEQLVEDRVDVLRRSHAPRGEILVAPGDLIVAMPNRRLVRIVE